MNRIEFLNAGGFVYSAQVRRLAVPQGSFHLRISTRWAGSRNPEAQNTAFEVTLNEAELQTLISALQQGLNTPTQQ